MKIKLDYKYLCIVGDIHGEFRELAWTIDQKKFEERLQQLQNAEMGKREEEILQLLKDLSL